VGSRPKRLAGLDGLRGLAALYVVSFRVLLRAFPGYPVDRAPSWAGRFVYGRFAVVVFIVLSGFSLALSPARHGWRLDAVSRFAQRRARRIPPAYWAALAFSLAVAWLIVPQPGRVPDAKSVLVNGLLVQNIVGAHSPNPAFWSMAVEAQLYLLLPLLLLIVRRWSAIAMLATVTLVVAAVGVIGPHVARLDTFVIRSPPDLAALFAVGILTAGIVCAGRVAQGVPAFLVTLALALPLTIAFARVFASVFEIPFLKQHTWSESARLSQPQVDGVPG
jgi:peptidoglycan/LPS O-acetylase OafA/YrhL